MQWADRNGRRLKLRDLHILLAVVQRGSMAKAAAELAISQPAISKAISDIEHTLGLRLLDRGRNGIEPTVYGRALVRRGMAIFDELKQGVEELEFLADPTRGKLNIGSTESIAAGLLPAVIDLATAFGRSPQFSSGRHQYTALSRTARAEHRSAAWTDTCQFCRGRSRSGCSVQRSGRSGGRRAEPMGPRSRIETGGPCQRALDSAAGRYLARLARGRSLPRRRSGHAGRADHDAFNSPVLPAHGDRALRHDAADLDLALQRQKPAAEGTPNPASHSAAAGWCRDVEEPHAKSSGTAFHRMCARDREAARR